MTIASICGQGSRSRKRDEDAGTAVDQQPAVLALEQVARLGADPGSATTGEQPTTVSLTFLY